MLGAAGVLVSCQGIRPTDSIHEFPWLHPHFDLRHHNQPNHTYQDAVNDEADQIDVLPSNLVGMPVEVTCYHNSKCQERPQNELQTNMRNQGMGACPAAFTQTLLHVS